MKTYHGLLLFFPCVIPLSQYCFSLDSVWILCVSLYACVYVHAHIVCTPVFVRHNISVVRWLNENGWNDIQSSDIKHQRPVELWRIDRLQEQRERWLRGWKSWKKEIDEADRRQAAWGLQRILFGVWGSGVYVSQDLEEKLLPWGKEWTANEREMQGNVWGTKGLDDRWN